MFTYQLQAFAVMVRLFAKAPQVAVTVHVLASKRSPSYVVGQL